MVEAAGTLPPEAHARRLPERRESVMRRLLLWLSPPRRAQVRLRRTETMLSKQERREQDAAQARLIAEAARWR